MTYIDFTEWLQNKHDKPAPNESDRVLAIIQATGRAGITRGELGRAIELERETLDGLLQALVSVGMAKMTDRAGEQVFWSAGFV